MRTSLKYRAIPTGTPVARSCTRHSRHAEPLSRVEAIPGTCVRRPIGRQMGRGIPCRGEGCREPLAQVVETIRTSGADVVGIQEGVMNAGRIAERLGWYASERMQIISRHPLPDPPRGNGVYGFVAPLP